MWTVSGRIFVVLSTIFSFLLYQLRIVNNVKDSRIGSSTARPYDNVWTNYKQQRDGQSKANVIIEKQENLFDAVNKNTDCVAHFVHYVYNTYHTVNVWSTCMREDNVAKFLSLKRTRWSQTPAWQSSRLNRAFDGFGRDESASVVHNDKTFPTEPAAAAAAVQRRRNKTRD